MEWKNTSLGNKYKYKIKPNIKQRNRGDMRKIHVTGQLSEATGQHGNFFEKIKTVFRYTHGDGGYQILGLCHISFGQSVGPWQIDTQIWK